MAIYARVDLSKCNYTTLPNYKVIKSPDITELNKIYTKYCRYKKFKSVMPIFDSDYKNNDVIGYYDNDKLVAFSIIIIQDKENVEALQFAWDYKNPKLFPGNGSSSKILLASIDALVTSNTIFFSPTFLLKL